MPKKVRPPFDINKEFYVIRSFQYGGRHWKYINGEGSFPWRRLKCTPKELYRYWDLRLLECRSEDNIKGVNDPDFKNEEMTNENIDLSSNIDMHSKVKPLKAEKSIR